MSGDTHGFEIPAEILVGDRESLAKVPRVAAIIPPVTYEQLTSLPNYLQKKVGRNKQYSLHNPPDPALVARMTAEHLFGAESEARLDSDQWRVLAWIAQKGIVWMKSVPKWGVDGDEFLLRCRKRLKLEPSVIGHVILPSKNPSGESLQKIITAEENLTQISVSSDPEPVKAEIKQAKYDWTLELSQEESRAILEQFKDRLPRDCSLNDAMVAVHVTNSKGKRKEENSVTVVDHDFGSRVNPFFVQELSQISKDLIAIATRLDRINQLLASIAGKDFSSFQELESTVHSIQEIVDRGKYELVSAEAVHILGADKKKRRVPRVKFEQDAVVAVSVDNPSSGYPNGRVAVRSIGDEHPTYLRRVQLVALRMRQSTTAPH